MVTILSIIFGSIIFTLGIIYLMYRYVTRCKHVRCYIQVARFITDKEREVIQRCYNCGHKHKEKITLVPGWENTCRVTDIFILRSAKGITNKEFNKLLKN